MIYVVVIVVLLSIVFGLGLASATHDEAKAAALLKNAKRRKPSSYVQDIEAKGHKVQVIDLDTGEVYEPGEKA